MFERLLDKNHRPDDDEIERFLGQESSLRLRGLEEYLNQNYNFVKDLRFPFGGGYGWGWKYSHGTKHLCYAFFEEGAFTVTLQIGDREVPALEKRLPDLLTKTTELWANRYPCGENGGWVHYRVLNNDELHDVIELIKIRKKPSVSGK